MLSKVSGENRSLGSSQLIIRPPSMGSHRILGVGKCSGRKSVPRVPALEKGYEWKTARGALRFSSRLSSSVQLLRATLPSSSELLTPPLCNLGVFLTWDAALLHPMAESLNLSTIDILDRIIPCCESLVNCRVVRQHPWPLPSTRW